MRSPKRVNEVSQKLTFEAVRCLNGFPRNRSQCAASHLGVVPLILGRDSGTWQDSAHETFLPNRTSHNCLPWSVSVKIRDVVQSIALTFAVVYLSACGSNAIPVPPGPPDVYAVGFETDGNLFKAVLWKNNVVTVLDSGTHGARANAIAVANGHVYVAGFEGSSTSESVAVLWTDGVPTTLTAGTVSGTADGVAVVGADVYVAGYETTYNSTLGSYVTAAMYWKNGLPTVLNSGLAAGPGIFIPNSAATSIAVEGSDVYFAGFVGSQIETAPNTYTDEPVVTYWKNGVATSVTTGLEFTQTYGIAVHNGQVYVAGSLCASLTPDCSVATLWTNTVASSLTPNLLSVASGVALSGSHVYAAVNVTDTVGTPAYLSTNGNMSPLSSTNESAANCVTTYGTDVYVGGSETETSAYWLNGTLTYLTGVPRGPNIVAGVNAMLVVPSA